jgi:hypothetical protein
MIHIAEDGTSRHETAFEVLASEVLEAQGEYRPSPDEPDSIPVNIPTPPK